MKVTINRELFLKSVGFCFEAIPNKSVIPIYSSVKMEIEYGVAIFTGGCSNVQVSAQCNVEVEGDDLFSICLPPELLIGTLSSLTDESVSFSCQVKDNGVISIVLSSGRRKYKMTGFPGEHYPMLKNAVMPPVTVKSNDFQKAFTNASSCVDTKELREVMRGCKVSVADGMMKIYGISNHFMTRQVMEVMSENKRIDDFVLPAEINSLIDMAVDTGDTSICFDGKVCQISLGGITIKAVCLYGNYPNFETIANRQPESKFRFDNAEMLDCLRRLKLYTDTTLIVKFKIGANEIALGADNSDIGKAAVEYVEKDVYSDLLMERWFNIRYMSNIFSKLNGSVTNVQMNENTNVPAFISSVGDDKQLWIVASIDPAKTITENKNK